MQHVNNTECAVRVVHLAFKFSSIDNIQWLGNSKRFWSRCLKWNAQCTYSNTYSASDLYPTVSSRIHNVLQTGLRNEHHHSTTSSSLNTYQFNYVVEIPLALFPDFYVHNQSHKIRLGQQLFIFPNTKWKPADITVHYTLSLTSKALLGNRLSHISIVSIQE
jgi:hypothetical protein